MNYLIEVKIPNKFGYDTKFLIESGTIEEIKKRFIKKSKLRFFNLGKEQK